MKNKSKTSGTDALMKHTNKCCANPVNHLILPDEEIRGLFYPGGLFSLQDAIEKLYHRFNETIENGLKDPHKFGDIANLLAWNLFSKLNLMVSDIDHQLIALVGTNKVNKDKQVVLMAVEIIGPGLKPSDESAEFHIMPTGFECLATCRYIHMLGKYKFQLDYPHEREEIIQFFSSYVPDGVFGCKVLDRIFNAIDE